MGQKSCAFFFFYSLLSPGFVKLTRLHSSGNNVQSKWNCVCCIGSVTTDSAPPGAGSWLDASSQTQTRQGPCRWAQGPQSRLAPDGRRRWWRPWRPSAPWGGTAASPAQTRTVCTDSLGGGICGRVINSLNSREALSLFPRPHCSIFRFEGSVFLHRCTQPRFAQRLLCARRRPPVLGGGKELCRKACGISGEGHSLMQ